MRVAQLAHLLENDIVCALGVEQEPVLVFHEHAHALAFAGELNDCLENDAVWRAIDHQVDTPVFEVAVHEFDPHFRRKGH